MFVGHFGVAFGAKRAAPSVSLGTLFLAAQLVDLLWPTFVLLGIETVRIAPGNTTVTPLDFESYSYTHSLVAALFGPPPPSVTALGWVGQSVWLLVAWGYWVDRHRAVRA